MTISERRGWRRFASSFRILGEGFKDRRTLIPARVNLRTPFLAVALVLCLPSAYAQQIQGYSHRHWDVEEGSPSDIRAITQTRDGFLWLGTSNGLYRFDGITFEKIEPGTFNRWRSNQITALAAAPDGALWVGYDFGGIAVYRNGRLSDANAEKRPRGAVFSIAAGPDGDVWVTVNGGRGAELRRLHRGRWYSYTRRDWLEDEALQSAFVAHDGTVWIAQYPSILRLRPGASKPEKVPVETGATTSFAEDASGALWLASSRGLQRLTGPRRLIPIDNDAPSAGGRGQQSLLFDDGVAWLAGHKEGLIRRSNLEKPNDRPEVIPIHSIALFRDREGTIWGGGSDGLVSYMRSPLLRQAVNGAAVTGFAKGSGLGRPLYAGTETGVYALADGPPRLVLKARYVDHVCAGPAGLLWVATSLRSYLGREGSWSTHDGPAKGYADTGCAFDPKGGVWAAAGGHGIFRLAGRTWRREPNWPTAQSIVSDGDRGFYANRPLRAVVHLEPGSSREIWAGDDIALGFIRLIKRIGPFVYLGGEKGLARYDGRRFEILSARDHPWLGGITGLAIGKADAWVITSGGIGRMSADDLARAFATPQRPLAHQFIGSGFGVAGRSFAYTANDAEIDAQGRAWFVTNRGVFRIDPTRFRRNLISPPVNIRGLAANGVSYENGDVTLPAGTSRIQLDYVALSLTDPARNSYRYRLNGVDTSWVEAGSKRQANYTGLSPGKYRFQVIAANPDGVWNRTGAGMVITITPFFWQTWWFKTAIILIISVLLWAFVQWRMRAAAEATRQRIEDRLSVREHIAQDLHDTLLQGFQGLVLRFQSIVERLPSGHPARAELESTLDRADDVLQEGRDQVRFLREESEPVDLGTMLSKIADDVLQKRLRWSLRETGIARPVCAAVSDDIARIAKEAIFNALRHAHASLIVIRILHHPGNIFICIADDGVGLDNMVKKLGRKDGHYGLVGMRERAQRLGAHIRISDVEPSGTEIRLTLPARIAYR